MTATTMMNRASLVSPAHPETSGATTASRLSTTVAPGHPHGPTTSTPGHARTGSASGAGGWLRERVLLPLAIERTKSRRPWILTTLAVALAALNTANGVDNYLSNAEIFREQGITWLAVWGQGSLLWSVFFLPLLVTTRAAVLTRMEHEHGNWRRMASYGTAAATYTGKLALTSLFVLYCQASFLLTVLTASTVLGFHLTAADVTTMTTWALLGALGGTTIAAAQLLIGIHVPSLATTVMTGLGASFLSLAITLVVPPLTGLYPYSQATIGMQARTLAAPSPTALAWFLVWNAFLITAAAMLSARALRRKEH